jgi:CRP-like cAMP-binding protein
MDQANLIKLLKSGSAQNKQKGQLVHTFDDTEKFYYIESGYIKRYLISNEGSLGIQSIYGPGYFFPLSPLFGALFGQNIIEETYYYEAMTAVQTYSLEVQTVVNTMQEDLSLYPNLLFEAWRRLQSNITQLENTSFKSAYQKIAHGIVFLAIEFGQQDEIGPGITMDLPLVYQDIASILGLTRETVARAMSMLKSKGLILVDNQRYINVPDSDKLRAIYK